MMPDPTLDPGPLAQLVEQGTFNPKVAGSIPARPIASERNRDRSGDGPESPNGHEGPAARRIPPSRLYASEAEHRTDAVYASSREIGCRLGQHEVNNCNE